MAKSLATIEQYKRYNRVLNNGAGSASKGLQVSTNESDEEIQLYLDSASALIRNYTSRNFTPTLYKESTFSFDGGYYTTYEDISRIISVNQNNMVISERVNFAGNTIYSDYFTGGVLLVEYEAGSEEIPADITQSCIYLASLFSRQKDRVGLASIAQGESTTSYIVEDLPATIKTILENYRVWWGDGNKIISKVDING